MEEHLTWVIEIYYRIVAYFSRNILAKSPKESIWNLGQSDVVQKKTLTFLLWDIRMVKIITQTNSEFLPEMNKS